MSLFDINEELPSSYSGGTIINKLFRDDVPVRFPKKDGDTVVLVMPAFGPNNESYAPYRELSGGNYAWTRWATQFRSYQLIGGRLNYIDPIMFGDGSPDPVKALLDVANTTAEFYHLVNKGPDGKKLEGNPPPPSLSAPGVKFAMNCVELSPRKSEDNGLSRVFILNETAVKPKARRPRNGQPADTGAWGLIAALNMRQRQVEGVDPGDFSRYYYWGDITNPNALVPCKILKQSPATGGMPIWKMEPTQDLAPMQGSQAMLDSRTPLTDLFVESDPKDIVDILVDIYGGEYPNLIRRAFEATYPGISNVLRQTGVVSPSRVHMSATDQPARPAFAPAAAIAAAPTTFAPAAPAIPAFAPAAPAAPAPAFAPAAGLPVAGPTLVVGGQTLAPAFTPAVAPAATPVPAAPPVPTVAVSPAAVALTAEQIRADLLGAAA